MKYEAVRILLGVEIHPGATAAVLAALIPRFDIAALNQLEKGEALLGTEAYVSGAAAALPFGSCVISVCVAFIKGEEIASVLHIEAIAQIAATVLGICRGVVKVGDFFQVDVRLRHFERFLGRRALRCSVLCRIFALSGFVLCCVSLCGIPRLCFLGSRFRLACRCRACIVLFCRGVLICRAGAEPQDEKQAACE